MHSSMLNNDRVRKNTADHVNRKIDQRTEDNIWRHELQGYQSKKGRLNELEREWDIERALEATSAMNVLTGLILGITVNKKWLLLSAISAGFLMQHAIQGWCPPLPLFRRLGYRTANEINQERDALLRSEWTPHNAPASMREEGDFR